MTPPHNFPVPIVHVLSEVYKETHRLGNKISKRDRFGIWARIEQYTLECIELSIRASFSSGQEKTPPLVQLRVMADVVKRLIRICQELGVIEEKKYFLLQEKWVEISKMTHGWLAYLQRKELLERNSHP